MDNIIDKKELKKLLEQLSWYELMTSQHIIDLYVEHIRESPVPYECEDEEKEKVHTVSGTMCNLCNKRRI